MLPSPGISDYAFVQKGGQADMEIDMIKALGVYTDRYKPESDFVLDPDIPNLDVDFVHELIDKIEGGVSGCCP